MCIYIYTHIYLKKTQLFTGKKAMREIWNTVLTKPDKNLISNVRHASGKEVQPRSEQDPLAQVAQGCGQVRAEYLQVQSP